MKWRNRNPQQPVAPWSRERLLATVQLRDGAVATSGTGERPGQLVDPRSAAAVGAGVGASFVSESLCDADVWSTVAAVAGIDDLGRKLSFPNERRIADIAREYIIHQL